MKIIFRCFKEKQLVLCVKYMSGCEVSQHFKALLSAILSFHDKYKIMNVLIIVQNYDKVNVMSDDHSKL